MERGTAWIPSFVELLSDPGSVCLDDGRYFGVQRDLVAEDSSLLDVTDQPPLVALAAKAAAY